MRKVQLNCDLGEGGKYDHKIMPLISSCNIACGGHFGDESSIAETIDLAKRHRVLIGAHPSYPDVQNFGRKSLNLNHEDLKESLTSQLKLFFDVLVQKNQSIHHIKPHGALYHDSAKNNDLAELFLEVVHQFTKDIVIYTAPNSILHEFSNSNYRIYSEVFADRAYDQNADLMSRTKPNAVLNDKKQVSEQVLNFVLHQKVKVQNKDWISINFDTICFHSDSPNAVENLALVNQILHKHNIQIEKSNDAI